MTGKNGKKDNVFNSSKSDSVIVLFDNSSRLEDITDLVQQKNITIITLDYESHKILSGNKINHEISDNYLDEKILENIQNESYRFSRWYDEPKIAKQIMYNDINLGKLFYPEFHYFLVLFLKKFVELKKIFDRHNGSEFIASADLHETARFLNASVNKLEKSNTLSNNSFLYDSVKINLKLGNRSCRINISKTQYQRIKKLSEIITHLLFGPKRHLHSNKVVLFVELDTIRYEKLFSILPQFKIEGLFYGRRRPAIWNLKSYSIIKKSRCKVATYHSMVDEKVKMAIEKNTSIVNSIIDFLWSQENFFKEFFSINGSSFWQILKPSFTELCRKRISEAIEEIELAKKLFEKYKFDSILVWSENGFNEQIVISIAKQFNIPIVLIQHGLYYDALESYEFNKFAGVLPLDSDKFVVWGDILKQYAINCGVIKDKIEILGSPLHDKFFKAKAKVTNPESSFVLLATSGPDNSFVSDCTVKTRETYEETIKKICSVVSQMNKKLVIKLHPFQGETDITKIAKEIDPKIEVIKGGNLLSLLQSCEVVIVMDMSTVIVESQILEKPVISVSAKKQYLGNSVIFESDSCVQTDLNNFQVLFNHVMNDPDYRTNLINKGNKFVNEYFSNQGNASEKLLAYLERI